MEDQLTAHPGRVSILVRDFAGEVLYERQSDEIFPSASLIKLPLLIRALQRVEKGDLDLGERLVVNSGDRVGGSGVLYELDGDLAPTLRDLLTLMIVVSDNTATNLVIEHVGLDDVNAFLREQGLKSTELVGLLQLPPKRRNARQRAGGRNRTSARDMAELLLRLVNGQLLSPTMTDLALDILSRQQLRDIVGRNVPRGQDGELLYRVASKSGELNGVHHDVGIVWTPRPLIVAVISGGGHDPREHPDNREVALLARFAGDLIARHGDILPGTGALE